MKKIIRSTVALVILIAGLSLILNSCGGCMEEDMYGNIQEDPAWIVTERSDTLTKYGLRIYTFELDTSTGFNNLYSRPSITYISKDTSLQVGEVLYMTRRLDPSAEPEQLGDPIEQQDNPFELPERKMLEDL